MPKLIDFNKSVKSGINHEIKEELPRFVELADNLAQKSLMEISYDAGITDLRKLLNQHIELLWGCYIAKLACLTRNVILAVNQEDFLIYGMLGRSIIENAAVFRFYDMKELFPRIQGCVEKGHVTRKEVSELIEIMDKHLRGGQFEWNLFHDGNFEKLIEREKWPIKQVRVGDCIKEWSKEFSMVGIYYDLFCDLVHPNLGSNLLLARVWSGGGGYGGARGYFHGFDIFQETFKMLSDISKEFAHQVDNLLYLRFEDESSK
jgi:hypothetical protein